MIGKWLSIFLALAVLSGFLLACASPPKNQKIKCVKCGAFFTTEEGAEEFKWMQGR
jgi:hypothetical protein